MSLDAMHCEVKHTCVLPCEVVDMCILHYEVVGICVLPCEVIDTHVLYCEVAGMCVLPRAVMHLCVLHCEVTHTCVLHQAGTWYKFSELALSLFLPSCVMIMDGAVTTLSAASSSSSC